MTEQRPLNSLSKAELGANRSIAQPIFIGRKNFSPAVHRQAGKKRYGRASTVQCDYSSIKSSISLLSK
ncbi:hypothetical protein ASC85_00870 [Pseudomonas sp. Root401]|nr:hypothetical protein ASC85_00870 [Pseudomonas sp. Root401]